MDLKQFFFEFQNHLAPKLNTYEQAIYLYLFRYSHLNDTNEAVISSRSSIKRMAVGLADLARRCLKISAARNCGPLSRRVVYQSLVLFGTAHKSASDFQC